MKIAAITAIYGGYDAPKPIPCDVEAVMVTDVPVQADGWRNVVAPIDEPDPRMAAKYAKCRPDMFVDADVIVWFDASIEIYDPELVHRLVDQLGDGDFGAFRHTFNHSLSAEARCAHHVAHKYDDCDMPGQVAHYKALGHPDAWGNWTSGLTVRRVNDTMRKVGDDWLAEMQRWGVEDQISLPFVLRNNGVQPVDLPFEGWGNKRFLLHAHSDGSR